MPQRVPWRSVLDVGSLHNDLLQLLGNGLLPAG